ncbi:MAG: type IV secretory system conjugative DNA transfer family protein, partial [Clostridia bacterium]|nr:type IV secretory system conjugative DNA transfer family protein [Clostridia bacterium]
MYEAKFSKYITKSHSRFAEPEEITAGLQKTGSSGSTCAGVPLYYDGECLYEDTSDAHTIGVGPTGCKKTRTLVIPLVNSIISAGESAVINDPKGELYKYTGGLARQRGADIRILNFRKPSSSNGWNPLSMPYKYYKMGEEEEAVQAINDFISSVIAPLLEKTVDRYWSDSANSFMVSAALMLMDSVPAAYFNLKNLIQFCYEDNAPYLKKMVENMDQSSSAVMGMRPTLDLEAERTKSCIFSTVLSAFSPFMKNNKLLDMLCADDISFTGLGEKQTIIYVIYPDEKTNLNFLVNAFLTQCYEALISISEKDHGGRVPLRVNFVLDEFSNLPAIPNFDNRISEARSHNVRFHLFIQSYGQLQNKYKEHAETILSNCNNWICFSSKEIGFLKT